MVKKILVISPHPDDGELWAGASMARWAAAGAEIDHVCLSALGDDERLAEFYAACKALDVSPLPNSFPDMGFQDHRRLIYDKLLQCEENIRPDLVIIPPTGDRHQDHAVVHEEAKRVFRFCSLLGFDIPYNEPTNRPTWYQEMTEAELMTKMEAVNCYKSQKYHQYTGVSAIRGLALVRGCEIRQEYAEAFEVIRWLN